jgi:hypothetical protein
MNRIQGSLAVFVLLGACVPVLPHRYAMPEADGGTTLANKCWGTKETIRFEREGVGVEVRLTKEGDASWMLEVRFDVPAGKTVKLIGTDTRIYSSKRKDIIRVNFTGMSRNGNPALAPIETMVGGQQPLIPASPMHFWIFAPVTDYETDGALFALPPFTVNGIVVELPTVRFTRKTDLQVAAPLQC